MIKIISKEYAEDNVATCEKAFLIFGKVLFKSISTTTNSSIVNQLKNKKQKTNKIGFIYESKS